MTAPGIFTPYSTIRPFLPTALPSWVDPLEAERIASYQKYEEMFWSSEEGFQRVMRGDNDMPVFLPTARTLIKTVNRYVANDFSYIIDGEDPSQIQVARIAFQKMFARERFLAKFYSGKIYGLIRGDWLWHIVADSEKPVGSRISIRNVDPGAFFPVWDPEDPEKIIKVHLAEQFEEDGKIKINRLTYEKIEGRIWSSHGIFGTEKWWELERPERVILPLGPLPEEITAIPVYHIKNFDDNAPYGSSELRGLESVLAALNQTISDEDLTLALEGIGIYTTPGGAPRDERGNEVDWIMGPGRVLTHAEGMKRLQGGSVSSYGEHYQRLKEAAQEGVGASGAAVGKVDDKVAESGVALAMQLSPILSDAKEKDRTIVDVHTQLFYDLCSWLAAYEELPLLREGIPTVVITPTIGDKLPINRKQVIQEVINLRSTVPPTISLRTAHQMLREAGVDVPEEELAIMVREAENNFDPLQEPTGIEEEDFEERLESEEANV